MKPNQERGPYPFRPEINIFCIHYPSILIRKYLIPTCVLIDAVITARGDLPSLSPMCGETANHKRATLEAQSEIQHVLWSGKEETDHDLDE